MHLKDNVKRKMSELNIDLSAAREIKGDIFGDKLESAREGGLVDCQSEKEYNKALAVIVKWWSPLYKNAKSFLKYFSAGPANTIKHASGHLLNVWTRFPFYYLHSESQRMS